MNEEMSIAGPAMAAEVKERSETVPLRRSSSRLLSVAANMSVEDDANDISEARLYLTAMTHFFSSFTSDENMAGVIDGRF